ncbi:hypothetical protein GCM10023317_63270 [Actinopolymorpha pittospori]
MRSGLPGVAQDRASRPRPWSLPTGETNPQARPRLEITALISKAYSYERICVPEGLSGQMNDRLARLQNDVH